MFTIRLVKTRTHFSMRNDTLVLFVGYVGKDARKVKDNVQKTSKYVGLFFWEIKIWEMACPGFVSHNIISGILWRVSPGHPHPAGTTTSMTNNLLLLFPPKKCHLSEKCQLQYNSRQRKKYLPFLDNLAVA